MAYSSRPVILDAGHGHTIKVVTGAAFRRMEDGSSAELTSEFLNGRLKGDELKCIEFAALFSECEADWPEGKKKLAEKSDEYAELAEPLGFDQVMCFIESRLRETVGSDVHVW
jgi:hypothetical protein